MPEQPQEGGRTVGAAAALVGVTVRTLHHWDEVGLASPSARTPAGYRQYTEADLHRLHRIVAYREMGLGLDAIRGILDDTTTDIGAELRLQRARLAERIEELRQLDGRLERMAQAHERGILLSHEEQSTIFGPSWDPTGPEQARAAWGDSAQWAQFAERSAARTPEQWQVVSEVMTAFQGELAAAMDRAVTPGSPEANALVDRHRAVFADFFPLTRSMQVCLGRMFESDPRFAAYYDGIRPGLATWFRQIIDAGARAHGLDPETATWQ